MTIQTPTNTASKRAELRIGSRVFCTDGEAGRLKQVVFSPRRNLVTHLVVQRGRLSQEERVIPIAHLVEATPRRIQLNLATAALQQFPAYNPTLFTTPAVDWQAAHGYAADEAVISLGGTNAELQSRPGERSGVLEPCDQADILAVVAEGMEVVCHDGKVGRVALVLLDRQTHHATHIVVRQGWLTKRDSIVPLDWAIETTTKRIVLDARSWQLEQLPAYRPDEEIAEDVRQALYDDPAFHDSADFFTIRVWVHDGTVMLRGNIRNALAKSAAEQIARRVVGVLDVHNELIADDELEQQVIQALHQDERLQIADLSVQVLLGLVSLKGRVTTDEQQIWAAQVARHIAGVQAVNNGVQVDPALL